MVPETCPEYQEGLWFERLKYHLKGGTRSPPGRGRGGLARPRPEFLNIIVEGDREGVSERPVSLGKLIKLFLFQLLRESLKIR